MATTSVVTFSWEIRGRPEGGSDQGRFVMRNSTGVDDAIETTATVSSTAGTALNPPSNAKFMAIIPPSTARSGLRLQGSTADAGIPLSSQGASFLSISTGTTFFIFTTATDPISGIRVLYL